MEVFDTCHQARFAPVTACHTAQQLTYPFGLFATLAFGLDTGRKDPLHHLDLWHRNLNFLVETPSTIASASDPANLWSWAGTPEIRSAEVDS